MNKRLTNINLDNIWNYEVSAIHIETGKTVRAMLEGKRNLPPSFARRTCLMNGCKAGNPFDRQESFFVAVFLHWNLIQGVLGRTYRLAPTPTTNIPETGGDIAQRTLPKSSCVCMKSEAKASPSIYYPGSHKSTPSKQALHRYITIANHSRPFHTAPKHCQPSSLCHGLYTIPLPSTSISLPRINDQPKTRRYLH